MRERGEKRVLIHQSTIRYNLTFQGLIELYVILIYKETLMNKLMQYISYIKQQRKSQYIILIYTNIPY